MKINRVWAMPNSRTFSIKPIREIIDRYANGVIVDPFANGNKIATITNDIDPQYDTDYHMDATDFLKMLETESVDTVLYDPPYCYDGETELFTKNGWKSIKDINKEDILATLNTDKNLLEYHRPLEVIKMAYTGKMVSIESQSISLLVTPNHRCYVKNSFYGNYKWVIAKDLFNNTKNHWFKKSCDWQGEEVEYFKLPSVELNKSNRYGERVKEEKIIPMDLWLKFLGLYLSEGCVDNDERMNTKYRYRVRISQKKELNREKIKEVLDELGYNYFVSPTDFSIQDKQLYMYLRQFGKTFDKYIPEEIKSLSARQLKILIDYLMIGDGSNITYPKFNHSVNKMYHYTTNVYSTSSVKLMNDFCEIALKSGYGITVRAKQKDSNNLNYEIHMLGAKNFKVNEQCCNKEVQFDDFVYCVSVPNSTLLVKRRGRVFWCGNSPRQVSECYKNMGKTVNMETTQASYWSKQKAEIGRIVKPGGYVITCCWNSGGIGKKYGFEIVEILLVPHGGWHNDTIVTVERKVKE